MEVTSELVCHRSLYNVYLTFLHILLSAVGLSRPVTAIISLYPEELGHCLNLPLIQNSIFIWIFKWLQLFTYGHWW